jgi:hypothetical protein
VSYNHVNVPYSRIDIDWVLVRLKRAEEVVNEALAIPLGERTPLMDDALFRWTQAATRTNGVLTRIEDANSLEGRW